ncbi:MAG: DnaJ domain-containing protein [Sphingomonadaceae bacterium]|jgi:hypothetical protein
MKLLWLLLLAVIACRVFTGRWPWQFLRPYRTRQESLKQARKLLGVSPEATRQEINEAHRRRIAAVHPDRGGSNEQVHEANEARDLLHQNLDHE